VDYALCPGIARRDPADLTRTPYPSCRPRQLGGANSVPFVSAAKPTAGFAPSLGEPEKLCSVVRAGWAAPGGARIVSAASTVAIRIKAK
jgi:hypothetical protein